MRNQDNCTLLDQVVRFFPTLVEAYLKHHQTLLNDFSIVKIWKKGYHVSNFCNFLNLK
jgi:hypothetical protein